VTLADAPVLLTAFMAGLLGSGHCFGMCGAIAMSAGVTAQSERSESRTKSLLDVFAFNSGRLVSYALLGALGAVLVGTTGDLLRLGKWLRLVTAAMILLIGLRFLLDWRGLDWVERAGAGLWSRVRPLAVSLGDRPHPTARLALGMCWGLLPCGLVYTMLLTAASTGGAGRGGLTMLAFGAGTLPSMLAMGWSAPVLQLWMRDRTVRRAIGFALVLLAGYAFVLAWPSSGGMHAGH
jgi:sulfite exporter TauE/SafE